MLINIYLVEINKRLKVAIRCFANGSSNRLICQKERKEIEEEKGTCSQEIVS
jgi:hypothetical protein